MAEIKIKEDVILFDDKYLEYFNQFNWKILKRNNLKHVYRRYKNRNVYMHHEILKIKTGECIDHINGNGLDNRKINLRISNKSTNGMNRGKSKRNKIGYKGVTFKKDCKRDKPYRATIVINQKQIFLGHFKTAKEAAIAYNEAAVKYHKEYAFLNEVE